MGSLIEVQISLLWVQSYLRKWLQFVGLRNETLRRLTSFPEVMTTERSLYMASFNWI